MILSGLSLTNGYDNASRLNSASDGTLPSIKIDDGDGLVLQNLITDGDVVSHELGHHIIFKTLTSTIGESLVLQEGLADAFAFFRTSNACLGESICPKNSSACIMLRTSISAQLSHQDSRVE